MMDLPPPDDTSGPGAANVIARLAAKEEARRAERAERQHQVAARADPREDVDRFLSWFNAQQTDLAARVAAATSATAAAPDEQQREQQRQRLDDVLALIMQLEKATSDASYYLPSYDLKQATAALQALRQAAEAARAALAPRKKFAFSSGLRKAGRAAAEPAAAAPAATAAAVPGAVQGTAAAAVAQGAAAAAAAAAKPGVAAEAEAPAGSTGRDKGGCSGPVLLQQQQQQQPQISAYDLDLIASGHGLRDLRGATIIRRASDLGNREFVLLGLENCEVYLLGEMPALRMSRLVGCRVCVGPVRGATFVDGATNCQFAIASHQVGRC